MEDLPSGAGGSLPLVDADKTLGLLSRGSLRSRLSPDVLWARLCPGAAWSKPLVVTDAVDDGSKCVELAQGLWGLMGGGGAQDVPPSART